MPTYTLNKIIKTVGIALLLSVGVMLTSSFVITPLLIVLLLFTNDFVTMSIATDSVSYSQQPDRWHIRWLVLVSLALGSLILVFSFGIFLAAVIGYNCPCHSCKRWSSSPCGLYRTGQCLSRPTAPAFLEVKAQQVAASEFGGRYRGREHSCF